MQSGTQQVLIDGGPDAVVLHRLGEELPWFDRTLEVVIATHPDKDHIGGLIHVLERYKVGLVILPQISHTSQLQNAWLDHLKQAMDKQGTNYRFADAGQDIELNGLALRILHPALGLQFGSKTNNASISMKGNYCAENPSPRLWRGPPLVQPSLELRPAGRGEAKNVPPASPREAQGRSGDKREREGVCLSFLLTGDAEAAVERQLARAYGPGLEVDILKAGHHGSKTSTSQGLLEAASPSAVVISAGRDNQYGHPHPDILERLKNYHLWRTDQHGSVRFVHESGQWLAGTRR